MCPITSDKNQSRVWRGGVIGVADYAITPKNPANYAITPTADYAITPIHPGNYAITPKYRPDYAIMPIKA